MQYTLPSTGKGCKCPTTWLLYFKVLTVTQEQLADVTLHRCIKHVIQVHASTICCHVLCCGAVSCRVQRIKVAAAAAQVASQQLVQQGQLLPPDGVLDSQGAVLPAQGTWLRSMLLLARTLHAAEATVGAAAD
jgi:hypothetical protein